MKQAFSDGARAGTPRL